jgi:hypothetical protein
MKGANPNPLMKKPKNEKKEIERQRIKDEDR